MGYPRKWYPKQRQRHRQRYRRNVANVIPVSDLNLFPEGSVAALLKEVHYTGGPDLTEYGWDPTHRPVKEISRHVVAKASKKGKKHLLVLPGSTGRDIELLRHYKVSNPKSKWTIIERESKYRRMLRKRSLFKNYRNVLNIERPFNDIKSDEISKKFGSVVRYDFAWFDLLGNLGMNDINWLKDSFPADYPNLDLFFTFKYSARGNKTNLIIRDTLWKWHEKEMQETRLAIRASKKLRWQTGMVAGVGYDPDAITRGKTMDKSIAAHYQTFKYIFNGYSFDIQAWVYHDQVSELSKHPTEMLLYHLNNFKPAEDYEFSDKVHEVIDVLAKYNGNNTDKQIADYTGKSKTTIKKWRALNKLPLVKSEKFSQYRLAVGLESLLISDEVPATADLAGLCCQRLMEFHPRIAGMISCEVAGDSVQINSPNRRPYRITIGDNVEYDPNNQERVQIIPEFLAAANRDALFSVFRNLFRGDEFLHPQLCNHGYKNPDGTDCFLLSDPQIEAINSWISSYNLGEKTGAIILPTGMGKTIIATEIVNHLMQYKQDLKILFFTKYKLILRGAIEKFQEHTVFKSDLDYCRFYGAGKKKFDCLLTSPCVFATDASLVKLVKGKSIVRKDSPLLKIPADHFDLVIADEAHHVNANRWSAIINHFKGKKAAGYVLGLTATPFRGDEQDPIVYFGENTISRKNLNRGIWEGYLSWPDYYLYEDRTDYREVLNLLKESLKSKTKEKKANEQLKRIHQRKCLSPGFQQIVLEKYLHHAANKKAIGFAPNKKCAISMAKYFSDHGIPATYLLSKGLKEVVGNYKVRRKEAYDGFVKTGKYQVLFSVGIFDEGVDIPDIEALIKLNQTSSPVKIIQQLGRGLRLFPGKTSVVVLDFVGNYQDLDSFINLGKMTGTNTRLLQRLQRKNTIFVDEDLPIIPPSNFHVSEGAKFIIKNIVEDAAIIKLSPIIERKVIDLCKKGYYWWNVQKTLERVIGVTREQARQLCSNVTVSIDEELRDKIKFGLLYRNIGMAGIDVLIEGGQIKHSKEKIIKYINAVNRDNLMELIEQCGIDDVVGILDLQDRNQLEDLIAE